jgi:hypothetical protein
VRQVPPPQASGRSCQIGNGVPTAGSQPIIEFSSPTELGAEEDDIHTSRHGLEEDQPYVGSLLIVAAQALALRPLADPIDLITSANTLVDERLSQ